MGRGGSQEVSEAVPVDSNTLDGAEFVKQASAKGATGAEGEATPTAESIPADWQQDDAAGSDDAEHTGTADAAEAAKSEEDAAADSGGGWGEDGDAAGTLVAEGLSEVAVPEPSAVSTHAPQKPPKRKGRMQMMELATAMAILAEPWDEEGERDRDLAPSFVENEDGSKQPLEGVVSLFLTGSTCDMVGIVLTPPAIFTTVPKQTLIDDIQFRGAISDFHAYRQAIADGDCDPLVVRANESDVYGDGNNWEIACTQAAADAWSSIGVELERRRVRDKRLALRRVAEKSLPKGRREHKPRPWISQGSEAEIENIAVAPTREGVVMTIERARHAFNQEFMFSDKDAQEIHSMSSAHMELRPFKDPNFDLHRVCVDGAVQAAASVREAYVQATGLLPRNGASQYEPIVMDAAQLAALREAPQYSEFLAHVRGATEAALLQNNVIDVFADDFCRLREEEAIKGNRSGKPINATMSFMDIAHCKHKMVSALHWHPTQQGVVAVSIAERLTFTKRVGAFGQTSEFAVLIWNFSDPIHPELVLESPFEVVAFALNPETPDIVVGGCYNGQVVLWDLSEQRELIAATRTTADKEEESKEVTVEHRHLSTIEYSHRGPVTDLKWLPGMEVTGKGSLVDCAESRGMCAFFATCAGDGKVHFWDSRVDAQRKKVRKNEDPMDREWRPVYVVPLLSISGSDLACTRLDFDPRVPGDFFVGSFDGEVVAANFVKPEDEEHPEHAKYAKHAHAGPVVLLARSPFFSDVLLSVGDWSFRLWRIGTHEPIFSSEFSPERYTSGTWSPTRPAVIFLGMQDGTIECWDLLDRSHEAAISAIVCSSAISSMSFNTGYATDRQQMLAVGDHEGVLHITEVPSTLRRCVGRERDHMKDFFGRQEAQLLEIESRQGQRAARVAQLEAAAKQQEELEARAREATEQGKPVDGGAGSDIDEAAEKAYFALEKKFRAQLGLTDDAAQESA